MALSQEIDSGNDSVFSDYAPPSSLRLAGEPPTPDTKAPVQQATEGVISATVTEGPNKGADVTPDPHPSVPPRTNDIMALFDNKKVEEATAKTAQDARDKIAADERADQSGAMNYHRRQMERANAAEAHELGNMPPPWDAAQKSAEMIRGPFESFGSFASIFALAASAFTKQPALNALSASAAAMTAIHEQDAVAYERAYKAWKDNTELVQKRFNMEKQLFDNASHLFDKDQALWKSQLVANAAKFNDKHMLNLLEAGLDGKAIELMETRARTMESQVKAANSVEEWEARRNFVTSAIQQAEEDHPTLQPGEVTTPDKDTWTAAQHAQYKLLLRQEATAKDNREQFVAREVRQYFNEHGELPPQNEYAKIVEAANTRYYNRTGAMAGMGLTEEVKQQLADMGWNDQTIDAAARTFNKTGKTPTNLGTRTTAGIITGMVQKRASELLQQEGKTPEQRARDWQLYKAEQTELSTAVGAPARAAAASLKLLVEQQQAVEAFENTALKNLDALVDLGKKVDRTGVPIIEKWIRAGRQATGDPDVAEFNLQWTLTMPELAKIMTNPRLVGQLTDAARHEVQDAIPKSSSALQLARARDRLRKDFKNRSDALNNQITGVNRTLDRLIGKEPASDDTGGWH